MRYPARVAEGDGVAPAAPTPVGTQPLRVFRDVIRNPDLRRIELAFAGFNTAEWSTWIAILVFAYQKGGPTATGVVALLLLLPASIVAPVASLLGDRYPRHRVLMFGYLAQGAANAATGVAILTQAPLPLIYLLAAIATTAVTLTRPTQGALLPSLAATTEELTAANAVSGTVENFSVLVGPAVTGVLLGFTGPGWVWTAMGALVLGSSLLVSRISAPTSGDRIGKVAVGSVLRDSLGGFRELARKREPRLLLYLIVVQSVEWGTLDVLLVVLALNQLHIGSAGVGFLNSAIGAGGLLGLAATAQLVGRRRLSAPFVAGVLAWALAFAGVGALPNLWVVVVLLAAAGAGHNVMDVAGRTLLQRVVPDGVLSRVLGVQEGLYNGSLAVGAILAPALIHALGLRGAFIAAGAFLAALAAMAWRGLARIDANAVVPVVQLQLLRSLPIFAPLQAPVMERLASNLISLVAAPEEVIIRQGEPGDRFYLIADGKVTVSVDGRAIRTLGAGDFFGEIALLRDVPRTATVIAAGQVHLYALARAEFIEAVTGHPRSATAAEEVIKRRLGDPQA